MATRRLGDDQTCRLLACPREIRDQIYAEVLLDFPTPSLRELRDCAMLREYGPLLERSFGPHVSRHVSTRLYHSHRIDTNILLTNRQILSEGKEILLRRGRLVQVEFSDIELALRLTSCDLCLINTKYSSLCMLTYYLYRDREHSLNRDTVHTWGFVLCGRDVETFCHAVMGNTTFELHDRPSPKTYHTLSFTTNFHKGSVTPKFLTRHTVHRQALQPFRSCLRGLPNVSIQGSSVGLSRVLAATALKDFRSRPIPDPIELLIELKEMWLMCISLHSIGTTDVSELVAPLDKAIERLTRATQGWNLWNLMRGKVRDPICRWFFEFYLFSMYRVLNFRFTLYATYGPCRGGAGLTTGEEIDNIYILESAMQMYEMSLAMPESLGAPCWTPPPLLEFRMKRDISGFFSLLRAAPDNTIYETGLALGYHAAKRVAELAPGDRLSQQRMEWYEGWKRQAMQEERFFVIDDEVMKDRGIIRWSGKDPGDLVMYAP